MVEKSHSKANEYSDVMIVRTQREAVCRCEKLFCGLCELCVIMSTVSRESAWFAKRGKMKVLLIGASGTIGKRIQERFAGKHEVVRAGRAGTDVTVDITDAGSIEKMYRTVERVDSVICAAGPAKFGAFSELSEDDFYVGIRGKLMGQVNLVRVGAGYVNDGGSFTLTTGILADDPIVGSTAVALVNGAVNSFVIAAAAELPRGLRVNAVCPTVVEDSAEAYGDFFAGFDPAPMQRVVNGYVRSVEGRISGRVIRIY
jgi:NAD(P)-dependent dehydrogenase (short-subunit alcohol dehydrogenase family)